MDGAWFRNREGRPVSHISDSLVWTQGQTWGCWFVWQGWRFVGDCVLFAPHGAGVLRSLDRGAQSDR